MKKIIVTLLSVVVCVAIFAGNYKLPNKELVCWENQTSTIQYNSYRVEVRLTGKCDFNVWGEVTLGNQSKPFMIRAGETQTNVDFENLDNGRRYSISVKVKN